MNPQAQHEMNLIQTAIAVTRLFEKAKTAKWGDVLIETAYVNGLPEKVSLTMGDATHCDWLLVGNMSHEYQVFNARSLNHAELATIISHVHYHLISMPIGVSLLY